MVNFYMYIGWMDLKDEFEYLEWIYDHVDESNILRFFILWNRRLKFSVQPPSVVIVKVLKTQWFVIPE